MTEVPSFVLQQVVDRQHGGVVAWAFEAPAGWQARGEVLWNFQHVSFPVTSRALAFDPQGLGAFEFFPPEPCCWLEPGGDFYPRGQNVLGQFMLKPMPATDALARLMVPKYRGRQQGLRIVDGGPMERLAERVGLDLKGLPEEDATVKIEYVENGRQVEEEIYGIKISQNVPYYGPMGMTMQINWGFARAFAFRAERGGLDALRGTFWHIASSVRVNPLWEQICARIGQQLQTQFDQYIQMGYSQIQAAGQLSRTISANNDAMLSAIEQQRQASLHSGHGSSGASSGRSPNDGFDEYIRGVETVADPYYGESQQDYNYRYHWTDGSGNYQHSNDPFFNPNIGSSQNWSPMEPKKNDER